MKRGKNYGNAGGTATLLYLLDTAKRKESTCISADQRYRAKALENDKRG